MADSDVRTAEPKRLARAAERALRMKAELLDELVAALEREHGSLAWALQRAGMSREEAGEWDQRHDDAQSYHARHGREDIVAALGGR